MREQALELFVQLLVIFVYAVGALITAVVGAFFEYHGASYLLAGEYSLGAWVVVLGGIPLLFSVLFITDKLIPSLQVLLDRSSP